MNYAKEIPNDILYKPQSTRYLESIRRFQGCPTLAVTKGGRIYLGWYAGGWREPHLSNYNLLVYSDDRGTTWSEPLLVIPSSYERRVQALDIQLFIDPEGALHVLWVQNNAVPIPENPPAEKKGQKMAFVDGYLFKDFEHAEWEIICREPDAAEPAFTEPRYLYQGFLRCKPTFLKNGDWLCPAYDQLTDRYGYYLTSDQGQTFSHYYGPQKLATYCDEAMAYQLENGSIRMFTRNELGQLGETWSYDQGKTWSEARLSGIVAAETRFYVEKLPSGRVLLIYNEHPAVRCNMTLALSEDDGKTWPYQKCIDAREGLSYPDAAWHEGRIYLTYDRGRKTHNEILFTSFTEQDIMESKDLEISIVSKPPSRPEKEGVIQAIETHQLIAILRGIPGDRLLPLAEALYEGGVRLLELTYGAGSDGETAEKIKMLAEHFGARMVIGAGTVTTEEQVRLTKAAGGAFIISPNTDPQVLFESNLCGLISIPGALTPTEILQAHKAGADFVKLFPVTAMGPDYVKAVKAPLAGIKLLAVGGVDETNINDYRKAGVCGFGVGSNIADQKMIETGDWSGITALAKKYTAVIRNG